MIKLSESLAGFCLALGLVLTMYPEALARDQPRPCRIVEGELVCAESPRNGEAVFVAMALTDSRAMLEKQLETLPVFSSKLEREEFRLSLERNWRSVLQYARQQTRLYRLRRLDDAAYRKVQSDFQRAEETYRAAIELYRNHIWRPPGADG